MHGRRVLPGVGLGWAGQEDCPREKDQPHATCGGHMAAGVHKASRAGGTRDKNGRIAGARKGFIFLAEVLSDHFF